MEEGQRQKDYVKTSVRPNVNRDNPILGTLELTKHDMKSNERTPPTPTPPPLNGNLSLHFRLGFTSPLTDVISCLAHSYVKPSFHLLVFLVLQEPIKTVRSQLILPVANTGRAYTFALDSKPVEPDSSGLSYPIPVPLAR